MYSNNNNNGFFLTDATISKASNLRGLATLEGVVVVIVNNAIGRILHIDVAEAIHDTFSEP